MEWLRRNWPHILGIVTIVAGIVLGIDSAKLPPSVGYTLKPQGQVKALKTSSTLWLYEGETVTIKPWPRVQQWKMSLATAQPNDRGVLINNKSGWILLLDDNAHEVYMGASRGLRARGIRFWVSSCTQHTDEYLYYNDTSR